MYTASISNEEIQELPLLRFDGEIRVISDRKEAVNVIRQLEKEDILGFDTEKKPTFQKGQYHHTALIQLSTLNEAFLFRLNAMGFFNELMQFMANDSVQKVGISIADDIKALQKMNYFEGGGFLELNDLVTEVGITDKGVRKLSAIFLNGRISKNQQTSNWENGDLSKAQQIYAATDAWVCLKIYTDLDKKGYL